MAPWRSSPAGPVETVDRLFGDVPGAVAGEHGGAIRHHAGAPIQRPDLAHAAAVLARDGGTPGGSLPRCPAGTQSAWVRAALSPGARRRRGFPRRPAHPGGQHARLRSAAGAHVVGGPAAGRRQGRRGCRPDAAPAVRRSPADLHRRRTSPTRTACAKPGGSAAPATGSMPSSATPAASAPGWKTRLNARIGRHCHENFRLRRTVVRLLRHLDRLGERHLHGPGAAAHPRRRGVVARRGAGSPSPAWKCASRRRRRTCSTPTCWRGCTRNWRQSGASRTTRPRMPPSAARSADWPAFPGHGGGAALPQAAFPPDHPVQRRTGPVSARPTSVWG